MSRRRTKNQPREQLVFSTFNTKPSQKPQRFNAPKKIPPTTTRSPVHPFRILSSGGNYFVSDFTSFNIFGMSDKMKGI